MSFLAGYYLGGMNRQMLDNTTRATQNFVAIVNNRRAQATLQDQYDALYDVAVQWKERAEWFERECERLRETAL